MQKTNYHPPISDLISPDMVPEKLGFIQPVMNNLLSGMHYKELVRDISRFGEQGFIAITLVPYTPLDLPILGTEMQLILNPGSEPGTSEFPLSLSYEWQILRYIRSFQITSFAETARSVFDMLLDIFGTDQDSLLTETILGFIDTDNDDYIQLFIDAFNNNSKYAPNQLTHPNTGEVTTDVTDLLTQLDNHGVNPINLVYEDYLQQGDGEADFKLNIEYLFSRIRTAFSLEDFKQILVPQASAALNNISVGLTFPTKYLRQVDATTFEPLKDSGGNDVPSMLTFNVGRLQFSTEHGLEFENESSFNFPLSEIGKTGLIVGFNDLKMDLSRTKNIPEASADGRPTDFIGVYITEGVINLPKKWFKEQNNTTAQIYGRNLLIGTGGISGNIGLEAHPTTPPATGEEPELKLKLGTNSGFEVALNRFNVAFQQNSIISSDVKGSITIPNFKQIDENGDAVAGDLKLGVMMHFAEDGDFSITAIPNEGRKKIGIEGVFSFDVDTFAVGRKEDRFYVEVSGGLSITADFGNDVNLPKGLEIPKLRIWEDGSFEMPLDKPPFPSEVRLKFGPVELYVSNMHIGSYEKNGRPYKYFGFDGGLDTNPTSVDAKGTGIKLYFSVDGGPLDIFVRIQRIDIDLIIPAGDGAENAALVLKGFLAVRDGGNGTTEYAGGVDITLPRLNFRGSAAMRLNPQKPNFIVDAQIEMNKGIPLGSTGLSIYGFRGLVGKNYVATKQAA